MLASAAMTSLAACDISCRTGYVRECTFMCLHVVANVNAGFGRDDVSHSTRLTNNYFDASVVGFEKQSISFFSQDSKLLESDSDGLQSAHRIRADTRHLMASSFIVGGSMNIVTLLVQSATTQLGMVHSHIRMCWVDRYDGCESFGGN